MAGLGGLGIVPASGEGMPPVGVEYVLATPSGRAVLRPLRYPFFDSTQLDNAQTQDRTLFTDHKSFEDGTKKTECDTNMTLDSQLGSPNLFDLVGFCGELKWDNTLSFHNDFDDIYNKLSFRWVFGQNTVFTRIKLVKVPQGIGPSGAVGNLASLIVTNGLPVLGNFYNFTTPDRKARRIDSVEQFRNELHPCEALSITGSGRIWTTYMLGILYSNL
jgi:hypothetical protein